MLSPGLEISYQQLHTAEHFSGEPSTFSRALYELEPSSRPGALDDFPDWRYANDEMARYFVGTAARQGSPEFSDASNRVAIVIGESSLATALQFIPEDTVIVLDIAPRMVTYMRHYIHALRTEPDPDSWHHYMSGLVDLAATRDEHQQFIFKYNEKHLVNDQIEQWEEMGVDHALFDEAGYARAKALARQKAIIPWLGNVKDSREMAALATTLLEHEATVTFINLTNVMELYHGVSTPRRNLPKLGALPIASQAPILVTSPGATIDLMLSSQSLPFKCGATGPFFGFQNLLGGIDLDEERSNHRYTGFFEDQPVFTRQYAEDLEDGY